MKRPIEAQMPPVPPVPPSAPPVPPAELLPVPHIPEAGPLAHMVRDQNFLSAEGRSADAFGAIERVLALVLNGKGASTTLGLALVERILPPAPSRAEAWWAAHAPHAQIPEDASLPEIAEWLYGLVKQGRVTPAIAAELIGQFKVIDVAGVAHARRGRTLRSV